MQASISHHRRGFGHNFSVHGFRVIKVSGVSVEGMGLVSISTAVMFSKDNLQSHNVSAAWWCWDLMVRPLVWLEKFESAKVACKMSCGIRPLRVCSQVRAGLVSLVPLPAPLSTHVYRLPEHPHLSPTCLPTLPEISVILRLLFNRMYYSSGSTIASSMPFK